MTAVLMLFLNFCKFGLLCSGGGYMLIPLLTAEFVGEGRMLTAERFGNLISISQLTPVR
jgi:chromate transporter